MSERPFTPYNQRLMAMAYASIRRRPSAEQIINQHMDTCGETFKPWTPRADWRFRNPCAGVGYLPDEAVRVPS